MPAVIIALDAGGTAIKAAAFDKYGRELSSVSEVMQPIRPQAGYNERDPDRMWKIACGVIRAVLSLAEIDPGDVAAIGLTGYGNGLILVNADGKPLRNAILSSDQRAAGIVAEWRSMGLEQPHIALTFQKLWAGKPLPLLAWLDRHEPQTLASAAHLLMCKDFLRMKLTGHFALEVGDASSGSLLDQSARRWTPAVLDLLGLSHYAHLFDEVIEPLSIAGFITPQAASATGLHVGTPVSAGYADGPGVLIASGVTDDSYLNVIAGTWGLNQLLTKSPVTDGSLLASMLGPRPGDYVLVEGGATSASTFEWFINTIIAGASAANQDHYEWCNRSLRDLDEGDPPVYFLPWLDGTPDDPKMRGSFIGLSSFHRAPHLVKAVFEGVAMEHQQHIQRLLARQIHPPQAVRFAGGASRSQDWLDIFAAAFNLPLEIGEAKELGTLGAAILAAVAVGLHPSLELAVSAMTRVNRVILPSPHKVETMARRAQGYQSLRGALAKTWTTLDRVK